MFSYNMLIYSLLLILAVQANSYLDFENMKNIELTQKNKVPAYEVSNYSKKGRSCSHNLNYWECGEWIGIVPGAVSRFFYNNKSTQLDIRRDPISSNVFRSCTAFVASHGMSLSYAKSTTKSPTKTTTKTKTNMTTKRHHN